MDDFLLLVDIVKLFSEPEPAAVAYWIVALGQLVPQRLVAVKVMLSVKGGLVVDVAVQCHAGNQGKQDGLGVEFWLRSR